MKLKILLILFLLTTVVLKAQLVKNLPVADYQVYKATITTGHSLSDSVNLEETRLSAIAMPSAWTTANLSIQVYTENGWRNLYYDDVEYVITAAANIYIIVKPVIFAGVKYIKFRSGTSSTSVNQLGNRIIYLVTRRY